MSFGLRKKLWIKIIKATSNQGVEVWIPVPSGTAEDLVATPFYSQYLLLCGQHRSDTWWPKSVLTGAGEKSHCYCCFQKGSELWLLCLALSHLGDFSPLMLPPRAAAPPACGSGTVELCIQGAGMCLQGLLAKSQAMEECWVNSSAEYQLKVMYTPN